FFGTTPSPLIGDQESTSYGLLFAGVFETLWDLPLRATKISDSGPRQLPCLRSASDRVIIVGRESRLGMCVYAKRKQFLSSETRNVATVGNEDTPIQRVSNGWDEFCGNLGFHHETYSTSANTSP